MASKIVKLAHAQGLGIESLTYCVHKLNKRHVCPLNGLSITSDIFLAVYNPAMEDSGLFTIYLNTSKVDISSWIPHTRSYQPIGAEAFCYPNMDKPSYGIECEITVNAKIPPLSISIIRITLSQTTDLEVKGSNALVLANDRLKITLDEKILGSNAVNFA